MSFPMPPNPTPVINAPDRFDEIHTLTCNGLDTSPNKALAQAIKLGDKYECALLSADFHAFKAGDMKQWSLRFKDIPMQGELYRHSGKWSSVEDNVVDNHSAPIYRPFTMTSDAEYPSLELEIFDEAGMHAQGDAAYGSSFFTIHIRHQRDLLQNEFVQSVKESTEAAKQAVDLVRSACNLIHVATLDQVAAQNLTKTAVDQCKQSVNLVKSACDTIATSTGLVKSSVDQCSVTLSQKLTDVSGACYAIHEAVDEAKLQSVANKDFLESAIESHKTATQEGNASINVNLGLVKSATEAVTTACDAVGTKIDEAKAAAEANKDTLNGSLVQIKQSTDSIKSSSDAVGTAVQAAQSGISAAVDACQAGIKESVDSHKTSTDAMSQKIRYKLLF